MNFLARRAASATAVRMSGSLRCGPFWFCYPTFRPFYLPLRHFFHDFVAVLLSETVGFHRGGDAQGHGHDNHMPEHNGHLFGEEVRIRALFELICLL